MTGERGRAIEQSEFPPFGMRKYMNFQWSLPRLPGQSKFANSPIKEAGYHVRHLSNRPLQDVLLNGDLICQGTAQQRGFLETHEEPRCMSNDQIDISALPHRGHLQPVSIREAGIATERVIKERGKRCLRARPCQHLPSQISQSGLPLKPDLRIRKGDEI